MMIRLDQKKDRWKLERFLPSPRLAVAANYSHLPMYMSEEKMIEWMSKQYVIAMDDSSTYPSFT